MFKDWKRNGRSLELRAKDGLLIAIVTDRRALIPKGVVAAGFRVWVAGFEKLDNESTESQALAKAEYQVRVLHSALTAIVS
jgi:hypothetical protein